MKRMLSMFLALCMVMTLLPVSAMAEETRMPIETSGEIVNFAPLTETEKPASLGTTIEDLELPETLTATVRTPVSIEEDSVQDSGSPDTVPPTTATEPQWVENTVDIQVEWKSTPEYDMNTGGEYAFTPMIEGYTVNAPLPEITVTVGEMPLMASAMLLTAGVPTEVDSTNISTVIGMATGDLDLKLTENVTMSGANSLWIINNFNITIDLNGKTIQSSDKNPITNSGTGKLTIKDSGSGGKVVASGDSLYAIYNSGSGDVSISGGTVSASGNSSRAIYNLADGTVEISGGTVSASGNNSMAIYSEDSGKVSISGGTVSASGMYSYAIYNEYSGNVSISGGTSTIAGEYCAINTAPNLSGYANVQITASTTKTDDTETSVITKADIGTDAEVEGYKYLKFEPVVTQIGSTGYTTLQEAVDAVAEGQTIMLLADITLTDTVTTPYTKSFELDLNGKTLHSTNITITHKGIGKLTIKDSGSGGTVSASGEETCAIKITNAGDVSISGGTVSAYGRYSSNAIYNYKGDVFISGGTVSGSGMGIGIYSAEGGRVSISGGTSTIAGVYGAIDSDVGVNFRDYVKVKITASTTKTDGTETSVITKGHIANYMVRQYKYLKFEPDVISPVLSAESVNRTSDTEATIGFTTNEEGTAYYLVVNSGEFNPTSVQVKHYSLGSVSGTVTGKAVTLTAGAKDIFVVVEDYAENISAPLKIAAAAIPTYTITANPTTKDFDSLTLGYSAPTAQTVTITNTGNSSVTLTQPTSTKYTIGTLSTTTLAANGTATFTVTPKTGLAVGNHNETLTVSTDHSTNATVQLSFSVTEVPTYTITANPTTKDFGSLTEGYTAPEAQTVTITNTGNSSVTLTQPTSTKYTIGTLSTTTLAANGTATFTVTPKTGLAVGNHNETLTVSTDHSTNATVELRFSVTAVPDYTVTFNPNGGTVGETTRSVAPGTAIGALPTPTRSGSYSFDGWYTAASGGTQISASTTVNANVSYYAHWTYTGDGGSGSGGGSSSNDNSSSVIVTPPAPDKPNSPTQGEIKVPGTVDGKGNITVNITDKAVNDAFDKALADAKKNGNEQNGITVILRVDTGNITGSSVTVNLPKTVQDIIIANKIANTIVVVDNPEIRIEMDLATVQEINKQAKSDVNITATRSDNGKLTADAKKAIGSRPVFDLRVNYGNGQAVSSFGTGSVTVTIPYILGANEKAGNVKAVYVDAKGKVHWLTNSVYDSVAKVLHFATSHFSTYGIGYKQVNTAFADITAHWAKEDIEFVVNRGLFSGTSDTTFSPNTDMTRGMFVTVLGRLANADVSDYTKSSFADVKSDAYYMGYIEWANKNKIVNGIGDNKFAPDQSITREQMAVIMQNYAKVIGFTLPKVYEENAFADNTKISTYAKEAVTQMQMAGVINGKNSNLFDPQGTAIRAEVSAVLRRFVELAISSDTAQGWTMNDSGKWMYYENGKLVTGKKEIDGSTYTFDQYGVTEDVPKNLRYTTYTVQNGDSIWSIAHKLGCTMSELERLNNKSRFTINYPGDVLRVPEK